MADRTQLENDAHGRAVHVTVIGGISVYEVEGLGAKFELAFPSTRPLDAVYEIINSHAPADEPA